MEGIIAHPASQIKCCNVDACVVFLDGHRQHLHTKANR
jgi:hypothetical protein